MDLSKALELFQTTKYLEREKNFNQEYPLSMIWSQCNMDFMNKIIFSRNSAERQLSDVIDSPLYSHGQTDAVLTQKQFEWWKDFYSRYYKCDIEHLRVKESQFWSQYKAVIYNNERYSIDLLRNTAYLFEIKRHCQLNKKPTIVELGSGCGALARIITNDIEASYVLVDIPESLYFAYLFISLNFPHKKCLWVIYPEFDMNNLDKYDYVFLPTVFSDLLENVSVDLFINTCSLGEMDNKCIRYWFDVIQNKMKVKYLFSVNRYLNTMIDTDTYEWRKHCNEGHAHFDDKWNFLEWRVEPEFANCPYYEGFGSRYLEIIAERREQADDKEKAQKYINDLVYEDWHRVPDRDCIQTVEDNRLFVDLGMNGTLFKLWDAVRLDSCDSNIFMYLQYLQNVLLRKNTSKQFEEMFYYMNRRTITTTGIDLSVILPGIRPKNWANFYNTLSKSLTKRKFELIIISPYDLPSELQCYSNIRLIKDYGHPTRCNQIAAKEAKGEYIHSTSDDVTFIPETLDRIFDILDQHKQNKKIAVLGKYFEGDNPDNHRFTSSDHYYYLSTHPATNAQHVNPKWKNMNGAFMKTSYFIELGGFDCQFEVPVMAQSDLAVRAQRDGAEIVLTDFIVYTCTHMPGITGDHGPIHYAQIDHDQPLYQEIHSTQTSRVKIDFDNWKLSPELWMRRFGSSN